MASQSEDEVICTTTVAVDKDKNSQYAVRWAVEKLLKKNDCVIIVHVRTQTFSQRSENPKGLILASEDEQQHFFLPYRGFCGRKGVRTRVIILHDIDISNALVDFIHENSISNMVLGASSRSALTSRLSITSVSYDSPSIASSERSKGHMQSVPGERLSSSHASPQHPSYSPYRRVGVKGNLSNQEIVDIDLSGENLNTTHISDVSRRSASPLSSVTQGDLESEMRKLRLELKKTMDMYSSASKEATSAKEKAKGIEEAHEAALTLAEVEKEKTKAAMEAAHMARQVAELEVQKRKNAETKLLYEAEERKKAMGTLVCSEIRFRKYNTEDREIATEYFADSMKVGEGGYGPVYKAFIDHTAVAIKVVRPDISQGKKQFEREVEVLSYIRHPNMVLLLGACPEYGCLVYEYMENGSLEDRIFRKNDTPPLTWQARFRIAAEIATSLLFLHQTKPEPLVHRDLKPANILLDRNYVSKISDVGLSRLVPASVADSVTQYHLTAAAGTFCYIDPEYQQTGMLGVKSDIYSFGILLLQVITAKPAMGLTRYIKRALAKGTLVDMLDSTVPDWPAEKSVCFAKLALKCCELRRKDRPDLGTVVLPELKRLSNFGLGDGAQRGIPRPFVASFKKTSSHPRPPYDEGPDRRSYCNAQTENEKSSQWNQGESKSSMNLGSSLLNKVIDKREHSVP